MTHDNTTRAGVMPAWEQRGVTRDRQGLLDALALVDAHGWDSEPATALLTQIRYELIRPLTIDIGLRGTAAAQAEASAWETVWLKLCDPHLRSAASPWGVIWQTARRAVLAEVLAARWGTETRRAWEHNAEERTGRRARPISLEPLLASGFEPADASPPPEPAPGTPVASALQFATDALTQAGWDPDEARRIVAEVALMDEALGRGTTVVGWRPLAARLAVPPWQARRLTYLLRGSADRPGLLARLIAEGPQIVHAVELREAIAATRSRTLPTPTQGCFATRDPRPQGLAS